MRAISPLGFNVFSDSLDTIILNKIKTKTLNTISPNSYGISTKDPLFREALFNSNYLVLDGVYFALASIIIKGKKIKINKGPDVFDFFLEKMDKEHGRVFFLGSGKETLDKIDERIKNEHQNITAGFLSPPFKNEFSKDENKMIIETINNFEPDIIFVGMTCPKQEKWSYKNKDEINAKLICSVGAVFDWYAGNQKVIHPLWWKLHLGWLKRTIDRPEILRRYPNIGIFFFHLLLAILGNRKYRNGQ